MIKRIALIIFAVSSLQAAIRYDQMSIYSGEFDLLRDRHRTFEFGLEYKFYPAWKSPVSFMEFRPVLGIMSNAQKSTYLYGGILFDLFASDSIVIAPGFCAGWYGRGEGKNLGFPLEFRTSIELSRQFADESRLGVRFYHISNASIGSRNPGEESLVLLYDIPVRKGFPYSKSK
jgi:lipid A 3-O-deacylase